MRIDVKISKNDWKHLCGLGAPGLKKFPDWKEEHIPWRRRDLSSLLEACWLLLTGENLGTQAFFRELNKDELFEEGTEVQHYLDGILASYDDEKSYGILLKTLENHIRVRCLS